MLSSHSIVSSSRTVRPCTPWGGRWIGHWRTTLSAVCSSAPNWQAAEGAISHLCKQKRKLATPVRRQLSRTHAILGRVIPGGCVLMSGMKVRNLVVFSNTSHFIGDLLRAPYLCCCPQMNVWVVVRWVQMGVSIGDAVHFYPVKRWVVRAEWSSCCPSSLARRARDSVAPLRQSSAGWMPAGIWRLSAGVGRRHPVAVRKAFGILMIV